MPSGRRWLSTTAIVRTPSSLIRSSASRTDVSALQYTGSRRTSAFSGSSMVCWSVARWEKWLRNWPERVLHQGGQRFGAELREFRRAFAQRIEIGARQQQRKDVFGGFEGARARRAGRQRRDWKALADTTHFVVEGSVRVAHAHVPALDDVKVLGDAARGIDDRAAHREVAQPRALRDELEVAPRHPRERQVGLQELDRRFDDQGRGGHGKEVEEGGGRKGLGKCSPTFGVNRCRVPQQ